jgi:hypothetical protein
MAGLIYIIAPEKASIFSERSALRFGACGGLAVLEMTLFLS